MKLAYQKPAYKHIALTEASGTNTCEVTHNYCWTVCPVELGPGFSVFNFPDNCTVQGESSADLCQYDGSPNSTVFGS